MTKNKEQLLINIKKDMKKAQRKEGIEFFKLFSLISGGIIILQLMVYLLLAIPSKANIVPVVLGYLVGYLSVVFIALIYMLKFKKGSITGIDYFEDKKRKYIIDKRYEVINKYVSLKYSLVDVNCQGIDTGCNYNELFDFLESDYYIEFKKELSQINFESMISLESEECKFKELVKELRLLKELKKEDLKGVLINN